MTEFNCTPAEKIATIVRCTLKGANSIFRGAFGSAVDVRQETDWDLLVDVVNGPAVFVRGAAAGWQVKHGDFIGFDPDLEQAAALALNPYA